MAIRRDFIQEAPALPANLFTSDNGLQNFLKMRLPPSELPHVFADLERFGTRAAGDLLELSREAEAQPPIHTAYDGWGQRIDEIRVSAAWRSLDRISAEEGLVAIGYERKQGEFSRLHQFAKLFLFHPSSAFYSCPLAMTDGAARVLELAGQTSGEAFRALTSRDPAQFWTSGQWMTERTGGSDVSGTSTVARAVGSHYELFGDKFFTSATTSQMALALAKVEGATDVREGLSLFLVKLRDSGGRLRGIRINRLKDKLGTDALPTAELELDGAHAEMIGGIGEGIKRVSAMLTITRLYNSVCSVAAISRALTLARDYSRKRVAFGQRLDRQPLHLKTLADVTAEYEATFALCFHLAHLLGREEVGTASANESAMLRLLTPVLKLWSAKQAVSLTSELLEVFGGAGYIEDTGIPRLLRDAQVFPIWEGTTNVLSLDVLRVLKNGDALKSWLRQIEALTGGSAEGLKIPAVAQEIAAVGDVSDARAFAFSLARTTAAAVMIHTGVRASVIHKFCEKPLIVKAESMNVAVLSDVVFGSSR